MNIKRYFNSILHHASQSHTQLLTIESLCVEIQEDVKRLSINRRADYLREKLLSTQAMGVTEEKVCESELIVSLTTYGERIHDVYLSIESIMQGSVIPNHIILWLAENEFKNQPLPHSLAMQQKRGLQIKFCEDILSYKKLIPTLEQYPDACIVTIDDDVMYDFDFLDHLLLAHQQHPDCVCAGRVHRIRRNENGELLSYNKWQKCVEDNIISKSNFLVGVGGVFYPPHVLDPEVMNKKIFMDICPYGDDIWFYAMTIKNGHHIVKSYTRNPEGDLVDIELHQKTSLCSLNTNNINCRNDTQIQAVFKLYSILMLL